MRLGFKGSEEERMCYCNARCLFGKYSGAQVLLQRRILRAGISFFEEDLNDHLTESKMKLGFNSEIFFELNFEKEQFEPATYNSPVNFKFFKSGNFF